MMNAFRIVIFFALLCSCVADLHAQVYTMTPEESVERALQEHGLLQSAEAEAREARAVLGEARSAWWPSISAMGSYMRLSDNIPPIEAEFPGIDTTFTIAPIEVDQFYTEISVEQPLFTGFRRISQARAAERMAEAAEEGVAAQRSNVALEVRQAYWTFVRTQTQLDALEASLEQVEAHLENVRRMQEAGAALQSHVLAAQTRRSEVLLDRVEAENAARTARLELLQLTGLPGDVDVEPATEVEFEPVEGSVETLVRRALNDHPEINALRQQAAAFESERRAAGRQWFPEAALTGRYVYARPNQYFFAEQDRFRPSWEAGIVLRWELWDGGRRGAQTEQADARLESVRARLRHLEDRIEMEVTRQYLATDGAREAVEVARETVQEAEESFRVVSQQFETGAVLSADVLEAEAALRAAQAREGDALATYAIARAGLLNALGRVW